VLKLPPGRGFTRDRELSTLKNCHVDLSTTGLRKLPSLDIANDYQIDRFAVIKRNSH
jgi:hypothetical protein